MYNLGNSKDCVRDWRLRCSRILHICLRAYVLKMCTTKHCSKYRAKWMNVRRMPNCVSNGSFHRQDTGHHFLYENVRRLFSQCSFFFFHCRIVLFAFLLSDCLTYDAKNITFFKIYFVNLCYFNYSPFIHSFIPFFISFFGTQISASILPHFLHLNIISSQ